MQKAYDRLSRDFIIDTLREASFPESLIKLIMFCITSVSMQVLWNGVLMEIFYSTREIRQGDHISPYIFVLYIERLGHSILKQVRDRKW